MFTAFNRLACLVLCSLAVLSVQAQGQRYFPGQPIAHFDWHPSGQMMAVSDGANTVQIINADTQAVLHTLPSFPEPVGAVQWSDDGQRLAVASGWFLYVWDQPWDSARSLPVLSLEVPDKIANATITGMDWNGARGEILAIASARAFIWDSQTGALVHLIEPYTTPIEAAEWSPDGNRLAVGDTTGYFFIENLATGAAGGYHISDAMDFFGVLSIAWSPDSKEVAVAGGPGYIVFFGMTAYDLSIGRIGRGNIFITPGTYDPTNFVYPDNIGAIDWHPTQNLIAAGRWNGTLEIWDIETETIISTVLLDAPVLSLAWSPDGAQLAYNAGANLALMPSPIVSPPTPTATPTPTPTPTAQPPPPACATDLRAVAAALGK